MGSHFTVLLCYNLNNYNNKLGSRYGVPFAFENKKKI